MYYWRIPDEVWRCLQRLHYPAPRYAVESVGYVQGDGYSYPFSSDHVLRHRSYPLHSVHGRAASAKSILAIVPSGTPPLHVRLQTGGYPPFEEFAHLDEKTHRPVRRRRVRRSALFPQQHETRRTPRPWVGALLQASGEQVPQTGSQDVDRLRPDSAWDPIRTRRHVAGCHPLRGFEQLFLRHSKFLVLFRQRCPVGGGRGWRGRVVVIPPWEQGPGHVIQ